MKKFKKDPKYVDKKVKAILAMFEDFGVAMELVEVLEGRHEVHVHLRTKKATRMAAIQKFQKDLEYALGTDKVRIQAPIRNEKLVGITFLQDMPEFLYAEQVLKSKEYTKAQGELIVPLGVTEFNEPFVRDLAIFPHLLIGGSTGSGKSTFLLHILTALTMRYSPEELRLILMDPKSMEMVMFDSCPHLLTDPISDPKRIIASLVWAGKEMERRYEVLRESKVTDIVEYHEYVKNGEQMPYILVVIDELADVMQAYPRELEWAIVKLAQKSRAVGIHLILATQSPRAEVVTGLIKANIPTRVAFRVSNNLESRIVIDLPDAERLSGCGDGIFVDRGEPIRFVTPLVARNDVRKHVKGLKKKYPQTLITETYIDLDGVLDDDDKDALYEKVAKFITQSGRASTSLIQRQFKIGYGRAARLMDMLEEHGVITPSDGTNKPREVIKKK